MAGPRSILKSFENLKGLDLRSSDITRDPDALSEFKNVRMRRNSSITKRKGFKAVIGEENKVKYGVHNYTRAAFAEGTATSVAFPGTTANAGSGDISWSGHANVAASDGSYETAVFTAITEETDLLRLSNFGLSIPSTAVITGVGVQIEAKSSVASRAARFEVRISKDIGTDPSYPLDVLTQIFTTSDVKYSLAGEGYLGGVFLSPADVNASGFGIDVKAVSTSTLGYTLSVDAVSIIVYYKEVTGDIIEEIIGIGDRAYRLKEGTFAISYSGANPVTFSFKPAEDGTNWTADLTESGTSVGNFPITYGEAYLSSSDTLRDLADEIDAVTNFSTTLTPAASVTGTTSFTAGTIGTLSNNTFQEGDVVELYDSNLERYLICNLHSGTTGTSMQWTPAVSGFGSTSLSAPAQELGIGKLSVANMPFANEETITSGVDKEYAISYWEPIPFICPIAIAGDFIDHPYARDQFKNPEWSNSPDRRNFSFVNHNNVCYWGTPFYSEPSEGYGADTAGETPQFSGLWKYDGIACYWAGLPRPVDATVAVSGSGSGPTSGGVYQYYFQFKHIDAQGNLTEGPLSDPVEITANGDSHNVSVEDFVNSAAISGYFPEDNASLGTTNESNTIAINNYGFALNQKIYFLDDISGEYVERRVVARNASTIEVDGEPVSTTSQARATSNFRLVIWRTKADGNIFYLVDEIPGTALNHVDSKADADLGAQLVIPDRDADPWPKIQYLTSHQGLLVGAGNPDDNDTVYFSDAVLGDGATPAASNNFLVPTNIRGGVTGLFSDTEDMLGVFKEEAYYNIVGDLDSLNFSLLRVSEGDWGCPCHAAIVKINESTMFPSLVGFKAVQGGRLVTDFDDILAESFIDNYYEQTASSSIASADQDKLIIRRAVGVNYPEEQIAIFHFPAESGSPGSPGNDGTDNALYPNTNSKTYVYDYRKKAFLEYGFKKAALNFAGGLIVYKDTLYGLGQSYGTKLSGVLWKQNRAGTVYDYFDGTDSIELDVRPQWMLGGEPSIFKKFLWLKLWIFDEDTNNGSYTWTINTYRDFNDSTKHTIASRSFDTSSIQNFERRIKLKSGKARALQLQFYNDTIYECPLLTGFELVVSAPFRPEMKDFKGG